MFDLAYNLGVKAASDVGVAGVGTRIALACGLVALGAVLAFDLKGISTTFHRDSSGFTSWGRKLQQRPGLNPVRVVGGFFLVAGVVALISVAFNP